MLLSVYQAQIAEIISRYARTDLIVASELSTDARTPKIGIIKGGILALAEEVAMYERPHHQRIAHVLGVIIGPLLPTHSLETFRHIGFAHYG